MWKDVRCPICRALWFKSGDSVLNINIRCRKCGNTFIKQVVVNEDVKITSIDGGKYGMQKRKEET